MGETQREERERETGRHSRMGFRLKGVDQEALEPTVVISGVERMTRPLPADSANPWTTRPQS